MRIHTEMFWNMLKYSDNLVCIQDIYSILGLRTKSKHLIWFVQLFTYKIFEQTYINQIISFSCFFYSKKKYNFGFTECFFFLFSFLFTFL